MTQVNKSNFFKTLNRLNTASKQEEMDVFNLFMENMAEGSYLRNMLEGLQDWINQEIRDDMGRNILHYVVNYIDSDWVESLREKNIELENSVNELANLTRKQKGIIDRKQETIDAFEEREREEHIAAHKLNDTLNNTNRINSLLRDEIAKLQKENLELKIQNHTN